MHWGNGRVRLTPTTPDFTPRFTPEFTPDFTPTTPKVQGKNRLLNLSPFKLLGKIAMIDYILSLKLVNLRLSVLLKQKTKQEAIDEYWTFVQELMELTEKQS
jgi:hypothetical protein